MIQTSLIHASLLPSCWNYSLHNSTYPSNILPYCEIGNKTPTQVLYLHTPTYLHLRTLNYLFYPNTPATIPHKLAHRSTPCVFLGYPDNHRGYLWLPFYNSKPIISRHVMFHEHIFTYSNLTKYQTTSCVFINDDEPSPYITHHQLLPHPCPTIIHHHTPTQPILHHWLPQIHLYLNLRPPHPPPLHPMHTYSMNDIIKKKKNIFTLHT